MSRFQVSDRVVTNRGQHGRVVQVVLDAEGPAARYRVRYDQSAGEGWWPENHLSEEVLPEGKNKEPL